MDAEKARKIGRAFRLGMAWGKGVSMAQDDAQWITVHPNGKGVNANGDPIKGRPVLIDSDTGEILGGAGGKFTGRHISAMPKGGKHEQPGAQMVINRAHLKKEHPEMFAPKQNKSAGSRSDNTFGTGASGSETKETNGLKIKQPENSEISLPKPAVPANWREMSYGEQFAAKMDMQKQFLTPDLDYSKLSEKDLNTYERVAKEAANERDRYFDGKTVTTNADLAQRRLDQIQDYKTYRGSALKSQEAAADVRQYGKLWESSDGRVKRLYLKPYNLGLKTEKYNTGNIKSATVNGEPISNSKASGLLNMEAYINLKTGKLEGSDAREFSKYFGKDIDRIISDNFSVGDAS